ncbi:pentapeptide repeat-containing protein [Kribbella sp. NPDC000426]|uniref:pentapeptide repeat-containing protein n=1 Tax=Kribbella sp. NPDC000426 TaxID=3154255 RepID=UPI0033170123
MRVERLTVWAVPVLALGVLAAASAWLGIVGAAVALGLMLAVVAGLVLRAGLDPATVVKIPANSQAKGSSPESSGQPRSLLSGADLSGADLTGADLRGLDLSDVKLNRAILRDADLRGARLSQEPEE